jgi:hypothetical protein
MNAITPVTAIATTKKEKDPYVNYRKVTKKGVDYFCRREGVTGSRTQMIETCFTEEQLAAIRESGQDLLRDVQSNPGSQPAVGPDGSSPQQSAVSY